MGPRLRTVFVVFFVLAGAAYFVWRLTAFNPSAPVYSALFYAAEMYGFAISLFMIYASFHVRVRNPAAPAPGLSVDVFITTYNEPLDVVRRTALAAVRMDYAHETWILDDGNRPELKALAKEVGCRYLPREKNVNAKAGNLNNGLAHATGEFVVLFDADHVAEKNFLMRTLGYFRDPGLAMVQTPQDYYNLGSFQHGRPKRSRLIWHEQSYFHYIGQTGRDWRNAATLCGCSAVLRRKAIDEVGGFATETVTEDMHTIVRIQKNKWNTAYHAEPLAFGIAPPDFRGYMRQRLRWGEGNLQVCREEGLPFTRDLTFAQRLCYFVLTTPYLEGWHKLILYLGPIIVLFSSVPPIHADLATFFAFFTPLYIGAFAYYNVIGRGFGRVIATERFTMARFAVALYSTLGLFRKRIRFRVSSKNLAGSLSLMSIVPQALIGAASVLAVAYTGYRYWSGLPLFMPDWLALLVCVWALINSYMAGWVVWNAFRCARMGENRYQFPLALPLRFTDRSGREIFTTAENLSSDWVEALAPGENEGFEWDRASVTVYLPLGQVSGRVATPRERQGRDSTLIAFKPDWNSAADSDRLDLTLISSRWHRRWMRQHEHYPSLTEQLIAACMLKRAAPPIKKPMAPILCRADGTADWQFALAETRPAAGSSGDIHLFGPAPAPERMEALVFQGTQTTPLQVRPQDDPTPAAAPAFDREEFQTTRVYCRFFTYIFDHQSKGEGLWKSSPSRWVA